MLGGKLQGAESHLRGPLSPAIRIFRMTHPKTHYPGLSFGYQEKSNQVAERMKLDNCVVMIVDGPSYPIAAALIQYLHEIEPERDYDSIIFTDIAFVDLPPTGIDVRDVKPLMLRLDERLGHCNFINPTLTITTEAYARLVLDEFLGKEYKRCLYIDYDVLFERALSPLFAVDIVGVNFAAVSLLTHLVPETSASYNAVTQKLLRDGLTPGSDSFNSGVMLFNLEKYRFEEFAAVAEKINNGPIHDQILLNRVYQGKWAKLSPRWNLPATVLVPKIENAIKPSIVHFAGADKPWHKTWIGNQTYRVEMLNVLRRFGASPPLQRNRKPIFSDQAKKHLQSTEPSRSIFITFDRLKRQRTAQSFLDKVKLAKKNREFIDIDLITTF
jgi:lipopolysaccharide biosynthesis glycosyltransferase